MKDDLQTLLVDNTGSKIRINVNGEDLDTSALERVDIHIFQGMCEVQTHYNKWLSIKKKVGD